MQASPASTSSSFLLKCIIIVIRKRLISSLSKFGFMNLLCCQVNVYFRRSKGRRLNKVNISVPSKLPGKIQERLLKIVVTLCRYLIVLQVLLPVEGDLLGLNLPVLHINLVSTKNNGNVLAHTAKISVPCRHILVCQASRYIKHDNSTLSMNVVTISKTTELLLTSSVPAVESDFTTVCEKVQWMDLYTNGGFILLLELPCEMSLDKGGFSSSTIADDNELETGVVNSLLVRQSLREDNKNIKNELE
jgi:hypothetical protein